MQPAAAKDAGGGRTWETRRVEAGGRLQRRTGVVPGRASSQGNESAGSAGHVSPLPPSLRCLLLLRPAAATAPLLLLLHVRQRRHVVEHRQACVGERFLQVAAPCSARSHGGSVRTPWQRKHVCTSLGRPLDARNRSSKGGVRACEGTEHHAPLLGGARVCRRRCRNAVLQVLLTCVELHVCRVVQIWDVVHDQFVATLNKESRGRSARSH